MRTTGDVVLDAVLDYGVHVDRAARAAARGDQAVAAAEQNRAARVLGALIEERTSHRVCVVGPANGSVITTDDEGEV